MTNGQALVALGKGYGVRLTEWRPEVYLKLDDNGFIRSSEYDHEEDWNKWCEYVNKVKDIKKKGVSGINAMV